jgi:DNA-directed RNA polymerase subunit A"
VPIIEEEKILVKISLHLLYKTKITLDFLAQQIKEQIDVEIRYSPLHIGEMVFYGSSLKDISKAYINGVKNIENAFVVDRTIQTEGSNLGEILDLEEVDSFHTYSNNFWEICEIWGIEPVREMLRADLVSIMPNINTCHIDLILDRMTLTGKLKSMTRYTKKSEKSSVISKSTFEETLLNFIRAAVFEEQDNMKGCSASIMCGEPVKVGTGCVSLIMDNFIQ